MVKSDEKIREICEDFIRTTIDLHDIPGIAVGVYVENTQDGSPCIFTGAGGYRNYLEKAPLNADTVFHCTSVSKLFTACGILKLIDDGFLKLSDRPAELIPDLKIADDRWEDVTIGSILTHTSGFTDVSDYEWHRHEAGKDVLKRYIFSDEVTKRKLLWAPASRSEGGNDGGFRYSSLAYDLLGLVISEVSKKPFEEYMKKSFFEPLEMEASTFLTSERVGGNFSPEAMDAHNMAMPHKKAKDRALVLEDVYPYTRQHAPSSTLTSTAGDLLKWAAACMDADGKVICGDMSSAWEARVYIPKTEEKMGFGWFIREQLGLTLMGHEGSDDGFRTSFWICPEIKTAVVLLCNLTDAPLKKLNKKLFEALAG